jgi:hypothetical protein
LPIRLPPRVGIGVLVNTPALDVVFIARDMERNADMSLVTLEQVGKRVKAFFREFLCRQLFRVRIIRRRQETSQDICVAIGESG